MRVGKVTEPVLKRSILKTIKKRRDEIKIGAGIGIDSAIIKLNPEEYFATTLDTKEIKNPYATKLSFYHVINDIVSAGAAPVGILISLLIPEGYQESKLRKIIQEIEEECSIYKLEIAGGHTEMVSSISHPILTITGIGKAREQNLCDRKSIKPGQEIVISKYIAIEGSIELLYEKKETLLRRYSQRFLDRIKEFSNYFCVLSEAEIAREQGVIAMHDLEENGIFGALWELAEGAAVGLEVDAKKIPIRQETIEICEYFDINPYEIHSTGSLLMVTEKGKELASLLQKYGINAAVIGKITKGNDRIIRNEEEKRYLEPIRKNESEKIFT